MKFSASQSTSIYCISELKSLTIPFLGHPNQCWTEELGYVDNGVTKRLPKQCAELTCEQNGEYSIKG